jgi:hypothetical protein
LGERLRVGVGDQELDPFQLGVDHVVDRVAAGAAESDHHDARTGGPIDRGCCGTFRHGLLNSGIAVPHYPYSLQFLED